MTRQSICHLACSCGWTGPDWAVAKEHIVAAMRANETAARPVVHEVKET